MTSEGVLLVDSREHRTQAMNREAARARLVAFVQQAAIRPRKRRPTKPGKAAKERRLVGKKQRATVKSGRGRIRGADD
jgi:ribosome-associated protein